MNLSYLFKNAPFLILDSLSSSGSVLVIAIAAANFLDPTVYGNYKYLLTIVAIAGIFTLSGSNEVVLRQTARDAGAAFVYLCEKAFLYHLIPSVILLIISTYYYINDNVAFALSCLAAGLLFPFYKTALLYKAFLNGLQKFSVFAVTGTISSLIFAFTIVVAMYYFSSPFLLILAYFSIHTFTTVFFFYYIYRRYVKDISQVQSQEAYKYSRHLSVLNVVSQASTHADNLIVFQFLGPIQLAVYSFAKTPVEQIKGQGKFISSLVAPRFSKYSATQIKSNLLSKLMLMWSVTAVIVFSYIVAAPFIFEILFPQYLTSVVYTQLLSVSLLALPNILLLEALTATQNIRGLYACRIVTPIVKIILLLVLGLMYGLLGIIIAIIVPRFLMTILAAYFVYRK